MAGHSHWANIARHKGIVDAKRGKLFSKLSRYIIIAARNGGGDPAMNLKLRYAIDKARAVSMPKDNIERAIKRGTGELEGVTYDEILYEGRAAGGIAILAEVLTDNRNRTAGEIRHIFDKSGGSLGATGCVGWMFDRTGVIVMERKAGMDEEEVMLDAIDAGAQDIEAGDDYFEVTTDPADFSTVREALEKKGYALLSAGIELIPQNTVDVPAENADALQTILDKLEDHDDVQEVYSNAQPE